MAQYLPVLLVSGASNSTIPVPDDSVLETQAVGQVDYLSHKWQEEDIAKSWRNMTRRKDSIANGARLENASWRTWWKQRNNLPTVSPEKLNWLKDSDVTWLYGPLHTAADWVPPRRSPEREGGVSSPTSPLLSSATLQPNPTSNISTSISPCPLKPILKHRSISELLSISFPPSPGSESVDLSEESGSYFGTITTPVSSSGRSGRPVQEATEREGGRKRPKLAHTNSESNVQQRTSFRRDSPPRSLTNGAISIGSSPRTSRDSSSGDSAASSQKRHISFNTFVEQCIAIEKPSQARDGLYDGSFDEEEENVQAICGDEDGYREDDEHSEEDDSDDDMLEMRPSPRSRSATGSRRLPPLSGSLAPGWTPSSEEREHFTIAPIAPTLLKTSVSPSPAGSCFGGYVNPWEEEEEEDRMVLFSGERQGPGASERSDSVNLVYVPPQGSLYAEHIGGSPRAPGHPFHSPPRATAVLRAASFDDVGMLVSRGRSRTDDASFGSRFDDVGMLVGRGRSHPDDAPFDSRFDFVATGPDAGGQEEEDYGVYRPNLKRLGRNTAQLRGSSSASDLPSRAGAVVEDMAAPSSENDMLIVEEDDDNKGSSESVSSEGTVVQSATPLSASCTTFSASVARDGLPPSPSSPVPSNSVSSRQHTHGNQPQASPVQSSVPTDTTATVSYATTTSSSTSASSYGSPHLVPPSRGRSTSPVFGDHVVRGQSGARGATSSLSDRERDPPRGRSRSRSNAGSSSLEGSESPRSGSRSRLGRSARWAAPGIDGGGIGLGGYGATYGPWRNKSLSPEEDHDESAVKKGGARRVTRTHSGRAVPVVGHTSEEVSSSSFSSSSPSPPSSVSPPGTVRGRGIAANCRGVVAHCHPVGLPSEEGTGFQHMEDAATFVGRAVDMVSSARGYLGSLWSTAGEHTRPSGNAPTPPGSSR